MKGIKSALIPLVAFQNFFFKGIAAIMASLAHAFAGIFLLVAVVSALFILERDNGNIQWNH